MKSRSHLAFASTALLLLLTLLWPVVPSRAQASPLRVAVFGQPGFPYYNASSLTSPRAIVRALRQAGVSADLVDVSQLADPQRFNARAFAALILPYGNVYPQIAFPNMRAFHQAGGCLILSGVPFTHMVQRQTDRQGHVSWDDQGHNSTPALFGPDGIGVGGFTDAPQLPATPGPGDPLDLKSLKRTWHGGIQALDTATLPAGDQVVPLLLEGDQPVAALIVHNDTQFPGAVDVWTDHPDTGDYNAYDSEQMLARGAILALVHKGLLSEPQQKTAYVSLGTLPPPRNFANLTLPNPPRPYRTFQPKSFPPARHLYVADVQKQSSDVKVLLTSLQGIVNRTKPRIYLIFNDDDRFWLKQMQAQGETGTTIPVADPLSLVKTFRSAITGAVVPDPKVYVSPHVAVDFAGLDNEVIATPALAQRLGLPIKTDLRGKFRDDVDAYRYVRTHLLSRLNPYLSICLDAPLDSGAIDQIIAARGMAFWVTGSKAQNHPGANESGELAEIQETFAHLPLNAVVRGFWWHGDGQGLDEGPGVSVGSRFGKVTVVSDLVKNYSVLSGVTIPALHQKPHPPAPPLDHAKVYVAITISDGDNVCTWEGYFRQYFENPLHGAFPIAWGMGPTLLDVAPTQAKWYYDHATPNDEFLCDVSGVGYIYPPDWATALKDRNGALKAFYGWTQSYMDRMDMHTIRLMGVQADDIAQVGPLLPKVNYLMPDYGYGGETTYPTMTYSLLTGQAVFRSVTDGQVKTMADEIRTHAGTTRPAFVNAFITNWGMTLGDLQQALKDLGPDYVPVLPSQLYTLYQQAQETSSASSGH